MELIKTAPGDYQVAWQDAWIYRQGREWYWQAILYGGPYGPFLTRTAAVRDYLATTGAGYPSTSRKS